MPGILSLFSPVVRSPPPYLMLYGYPTHTNCCVLPAPVVRLFPLNPSGSSFPGLISPVCPTRPCFSVTGATPLHPTPPASCCLCLVVGLFVVVPRCHSARAPSAPSRPPPICARPCRLALLLLIARCPWFALCLLSIPFASCGGSPRPPTSSLSLFRARCFRVCWGAGKLVVYPLRISRPSSDARQHLLLPERRLTPPPSLSSAIQISVG